MRKWGIALVLVGAVVLGACGGADDKVASDKASSTSKGVAQASDSKADDGDKATASADNTVASRSDSMSDDAAGPPALNADGIGSTHFGATDGDAVAQLSALLGPPTSDTGWTPTSSPCDDETTQTRGVQFGDLWTEFADATDDFGSGKHFRSYVLMSPEGDTMAAVQFKTDKGVAIGMTTAEAQALDPGFEVSDSEIAGRIWVSGDPGRTVNGAMFADGTSERVGSIGAGLLCVD